MTHSGLLPASVLDFKMFEDVGIKATLGLVWFWYYGGRIGRRPIYEYKRTGWFAPDGNQDVWPVVEYFKVSERKIGRWIRRGLLPKPGKKKP